MLQALDLLDNQLSNGLPHSVNGLRRIKTLGANLSALENSLSLMTSLTHLHIKTKETGLPGLQQGLQAGDFNFHGLFEELRGLGQLRTVEFDLEVAALLGYAPNLQQFVRFVRDVPHMAFEHCESFTLPAARLFERWDQVR